MQSAQERISNRNEVLLGYTEEEAVNEAKRCLNCPEKYCMQHCPASTPVPEFIAKIRERDFEAAFQLIVNANPMPGISSRVCPQERQCESHCTRGIKNQPVAIGNLERFVTDWHFQHEVEKEHDLLTAKKKIAVVGSGPAGLTCAIALAEAGFVVTIYEKEAHLGGVPSWGIPSFVLPPIQLESLLNFVSVLHITVKTNTEIGKDISLKELKKSFDAVFIAIGAGKAVSPNLEGETLNGVMQANDYLSAKEVPCKKHVAVIGGGNTAIDAARMALRSGAEKVTIVYRRTEAEMPATINEIQLAKEEGIELLPLNSPIRFIGSNGTLSGVECSKMTLTVPDYPGGRKNVAPTKETQIITADLAILALGFRNEPFEGLDSNQRNQITVDKKYATTMDHVFAGGDAVSGPSTVMRAAAAGKNAAASIFSLWV